jgi:hypothetical protein
MRRPLSLILAVILLITWSGCIWGLEHDQRGYENRDRGGYGDTDRGGHDGDRHDDRRDSDDHR